MSTRSVIPSVEIVECKPCLWILDDVPAKVSVDELRRWYTPRSLGKTLITTRSLKHQGVGEEVPVSRLHSAATRKLLTKKRSLRGETEAAAVDDILTGLGRCHGGACKSPAAAGDGA